MQIPDIQAQSILSKRADSLFNAKDYSQATIEYRELIEKHDINKKNAFLKMSYMAEKQGQFPEAIYYLSELYELNPNDRLFDKINKIARENGFGGFERSEFNFLITLYKEYYVFIAVILLLLSVFIFNYSWNKKSISSRIPKRFAFLTIALIIFSLLIVNLPDSYKLGIVKSKSAIMRSGPSAASEIEGKITEGNRVNIIGQKDIWYQIVWQRKVIYLKKSDLWVVNEN